MAGKERPYYANVIDSKPGRFEVEFNIIKGGKPNRHIYDSPIDALDTVSDRLKRLRIGSLKSAATYGLMLGASAGIAELTGSNNVYYLAGAFGAFSLAGAYITYKDMIEPGREVLKEIRTAVRNYIKNS